jgi:hypothetical protein
MAYERFVFTDHHERVPSSVRRALPPVDQQQLNPPEEDTPKEKRGVEEGEEDGVHAYPVLLTFLISMPDRTRPLYNPGLHPTTAPSTTTPHTHPNGAGPIPLLSLGTTRPSARLPSLRIRRDELAEWWDLSESPVFGRGRGGGAHGRSPHANHYADGSGRVS